MSQSLRPLADAMFASAAGVLGTLAGRTVTSGTPAETESEASIRIEPGRIATLTRVPSANLVFVVRYERRDLARVVELMLGTGGDGSELDAMGQSIVAETVVQISSAMGEALATARGGDGNGISSELATDPGLLPAPPFATFTAPLDLGEGISTTLTMDFDGLARRRLDPLPAAAPPAPAGAMPSAQAVAFPSMRPTALRPAASGHANLELVNDVPLEISAVLGQTELSLREVVSMATGSVFELDKLSTDPIDLYVNNILIARGEVVVVDDRFGVKISELNPAVDRL